MCNNIANNTSNKMNLDHTRPLALLYPLDETATCLCKTCNSSKRDRLPSEFYSNSELINLSEITGIKLPDLMNPSPNIKPINFIMQNKKWFFNTFLKRKRFQKMHEGKKQADLIIKALNKVIKKIPNQISFDIIKEYKKLTN